MGIYTISPTIPVALDYRPQVPTQYRTLNVPLFTSRYNASINYTGGFVNSCSSPVLATATNWYGGTVGITANVLGPLTYTKVVHGGTQASYTAMQPAYGGNVLWWGDRTFTAYNQTGPYGGYSLEAYILDLGTTYIYPSINGELFSGVAPFSVGFQNITHIGPGQSTSLAMTLNTGFYPITGGGSVVFGTYVYADQYENEYYGYVGINFDQVHNSSWFAFTPFNPTTSGGLFAPVGGGAAYGTGGWMLLCLASSGNFNNLPYVICHNGYGAGDAHVFTPTFGNVLDSLWPYIASTPTALIPCSKGWAATMSHSGVTRTVLLANDLSAYSYVNFVPMDSGASTTLNNMVNWTIDELGNFYVVGSAAQQLACSYGWDYRIGAPAIPPYQRLWLPCIPCNPIIRM